MFPRVGLPVGVWSMAMYGNPRVRIWMLALVILPTVDVTLAIVLLGLASAVSGF